MKREWFVVFVVVLVLVVVILLSPDSFVNLSPDGGIYSVVDYCNGWTNDTTSHTGRKGLGCSRTTSWTSQTTSTCIWSTRLYCFEQI